MEKVDMKTAVALDAVTVSTWGSACQEHFTRPETSWQYFVTFILPNSLIFQNWLLRRILPGPCKFLNSEKATVSLPKKKPTKKITPPKKTKPKTSSVLCIWLTKEVMGCFLSFIIFSLFLNFNLWPGISQFVS